MSQQKSKNLLLHPYFLKYRDFLRKTFPAVSVSPSGKPKRKKKRKAETINDIVHLLFCIGAAIIEVLICSEQHKESSFEYQKARFEKATNVSQDAINKTTNILMDVLELSLKEKGILKRFCSLNIPEKPVPKKKTDRKPLTISYVYRLTCKESLRDLAPQIGKKKYYYGQRTYDGDYLYDSDYLSSSQSMGELVKDFGTAQWDKKFIGLYANRVDSVSHEIELHRRFMVHKHEKFFNLARQTSAGFGFDVTGVKRSDEFKQTLRQKQLARKRSPEETANRRKTVEKNNKGKVTCPHCGKTGQKTAMMKWHFDNCSKNPNMSEKGKEFREQARNRALDYNSSALNNHGKKKSNRKKKTPSSQEEQQNK